MQSAYDLIFTTFIICLGIQLLYCVYFYSRLLWHKNTVHKHDEPVSVIIAAHNEEQHLHQLLASLNKQKHPEFEVIIINDRSTDATKSILTASKKKYHWLQTIDIVQTPEGYSPKKYALTKGIETSKYDRLLFTDADCLPKSEEWITEMSAAIKDDQKIVLGFSPLSTKNTLLGLLSRFETLVTGIRYLSFAKSGLPYMGVGRNLAYDKSLFETANGFSSHQHIISGDDDLFVQSVANKKNTSVQIAANSHTISDAIHDWKGWWKQKQRHLSAGKRYKPLITYYLGIEYISLSILYITFGLLMSLNTAQHLIIALFLLRTIVLFTTFMLISRRMDQKWVWLTTLPVLEPLYILYILFTGIVVLFSKRVRWN